MKTLITTPLDGYDPVIGRWLWSIEDTRRRTLDSLTGLDDETTNFAPPGTPNSIGTLLYHLAAIEMSWLYEDILEGEAFSEEIGALMKFNVRSEDGGLTPVTGESLDTHLNRLGTCRQTFLDAFQGMSVSQFRSPRQVEDYQVTPEWVIHHLIQHEAEHRGQIGEIRIQAETALGKI